jgi:hypothetical protein
MTATDEAVHRWSIEPLKRIANLPESKRIITKYGKVMHHDTMIFWNLQIGFICWMRVSNQMDRPEYNSLLRSISSKSKIPLKDVKILAKLMLAQIKAGLLATGQIPTSVKGGKDG